MRILRQRGLDSGEGGGAREGGVGGAFVAGTGGAEVVADEVVRRRGSDRRRSRRGSRFEAARFDNVGALLVAAHGGGDGSGADVRQRRVRTIAKLNLIRVVSLEIFRLLL